GEWKLWASHQLVERARMAAGTAYLTALAAAGRVTRRERREALDPAAPLRPRVRVLGELVRRRRLGEAAGGRAVWLVDGRGVRDLAYADFTLGGHGYRYPFISKREVWIDDAVRPEERPAILHH